MTRMVRHIQGSRLRSNRYDHLDRRVQKITSAATHTYFYDGWLLIKEVVANTNGTTDVIKYHWGKDLSGTIGGAGGIGGLLYRESGARPRFGWWFLREGDGFLIVNGCEVPLSSSFKRGC